MSYDAPTWSSVPAPALLPRRLGTMVARVASSLSSPVPRPRLLSTLLLLSLLLLLSRLYNKRGRRKNLFRKKVEIQCHFYNVTKGHGL